MKHVMIFAACAVLACSGASDAQGNRREPIVGLPCDGCEAMFDGLPAQLQSTSRIAPAGEPGEPMQLDGTVRDRQGRAAAGVIVYAYHTDARGIYPGADHSRRDAGARHGRLRGWARTDENGRYAFETIRPGAYPNRDTPQHVHVHVIEPGCCAYYIDDVLFEDDPLLTTDLRRRMSPGRGGPGVVRPRKDEAGRWRVTRDIVLGQAVHGYPADGR